MAVSGNGKTIITGSISFPYEIKIRDMSISKEKPVSLLSGFQGFESDNAPIKLNLSYDGQRAIGLMCDPFGSIHILRGHASIWEVNHSKSRRLKALPSWKSITACALNPIWHPLCYRN